MARILLVENAAGALRATLAQCEHAIVEVEDRAEALTAAAGGDIDLVILPPHMGTPENFLMLRRLKEKPATTDVPVLMAGPGDPADITMSCAFGAAGYISEPFGREAAVQAIAWALGTPTDDPSALPEAA